jgi:hypothetical protein
MPRVKSINFLFIFGVHFFLHFSAQAQPVLSQMIDQAKRSKLAELMPQSSPDVLLPGNKMNRPALAKESLPPVLWAMSGINTSLTAELLIEEKIYRFKVARGHLLPGGWSVFNADLSSLTIQNGKKMLTLLVPAPGASSAEFPALIKANSNITDDMQPIQDSLNRRGYPIEFVGPEPKLLSAPTKSTSLESSRQAASSLPVKP